MRGEVERACGRGRARAPPHPPPPTPTHPHPPSPTSISCPLSFPFISFSSSSGPLQYEDPTKTLMMLPTDMALVSDRKFRKVVSEFAKDEDAFRAAFAESFSRLLELGVPRA